MLAGPRQLVAAGPWATLSQIQPLCMGDGARLQASTLSCPTPPSGLLGAARVCVCVHAGLGGRIAHVCTGALPFLDSLTSSQIALTII